MWQSLPEFGTITVLAVMVAAAYTFAVSLATARGRPWLLRAARLGAYGTVSLIGLSILCLSYAFVTHDFRIRYVAHYSDRSMSKAYLFAALWGGQDGSILWWLFLLGVYTAACVYWLRGRFRELQPYVIATLMVIVLFFCVVMGFSANPFATTVGGAHVDGQGLNPLLQNFYMVIHPPSLYMGFVGCAVPFAFAIAALVTGRLDNEWLAASRNWMLFAWLFLSIGNALGMLWAYEVLGWGGYWAWDPVENAAFLPWLTATAFVHSMMIQERRGMLKVWNTVLVLLTFLLTIFGTFLTRSGLIASVHSFAQSGIGTYFLVFMAAIVAFCVALVVRRLPELRSEGRIEAVLSREASFVANNWVLLGIMVFVLTATMFPRISEWFHESSTVGPSFYNAWLAIPALGLLLLMGMAPLLAWRKSSPELLRRSFVFPTAAALAVGLAHAVWGRRLGYPAFVVPDRIYEGATGTFLQRLNTPVPFLIVVLGAFNLAVVVQEYARGIRARQRTAGESPIHALYHLVAKARHRYGGYVVHVGIAMMFFGFAGRSWGLDAEAALHPGETMTLGSYRLRYEGSRAEVDSAKRMIFADVTVSDSAGRTVGRASPGKFVYRKSPDSPTTEISILHTSREDLYLVVGSVNSDTHVATFQVHLNPMVFWIWLGVFVLIVGAAIAMWPEPTAQESRGWAYLRTAGALTSSVLLAIAFANMPTSAYAGRALSPARTPAQADMMQDSTPSAERPILAPAN